MQNLKKLCELALLYAALSPCKKRQVGCVVVSQTGEVISYGFNHGYHQACSCDTHQGHKNPHALHAEVMALDSTDPEIFKGASIVLTHAPCDLGCTDLIISKHLAAVYYMGIPSTRNGLSKLDIQNINHTHLGT